MSEVTIGSNDYQTYASIEEADEYLAASVTAESWPDADDTTKAKALVSATRLIDRQVWREGYKTVEQREAEPAFAAACCELAALFIDGSTEVLDGPASASNNIETIKAGSVMIGYFMGGSDFGARFPQTVQELLGPYLEAGASLAANGAPYVSGDACDTALERNRYGVTRAI